jgi:hypothetical protein
MIVLEPSVTAMVPFTSIVEGIGILVGIVKSNGLLRSRAFTGQGGMSMLTFFLMTGMTKEQGVPHTWQFTLKGIRPISVRAALMVAEESSSVSVRKY